MHFLCLDNTSDPYSIVKPRPQTLCPKTPKPRGLGLKVKSHGPPPHPITFKHEGRVPYKKSKSKKGSAWSPLLVQQQNSGGQQEEGHGVVQHIQ